MMKNERHDRGVCLPANIEDCGRKENTIRNYEKILTRVIEMLADEEFRALYMASVLV